MIVNVQPETGAEMCARWHHEREARNAAIEARAEELCYGRDNLDWGAAVACATNEYWDGDMPESVERDLRR